MKRFSVGASIVLFAAALHAQSSAESNAGLALNFGSPGARSLGLGGAFVSVADDATAVFVNPAGLTQLSKTEVALESRSFSFTNTFVAGGRASGEPTMRGIDQAFGLIDGHEQERVNAFSFASFVLPRPRWSAALYRHELANFRLSTRTEGVLSSRVVLGRPQQTRTLPAINALDLKIVTYGASFAHRIGDRVSVGATLAAHQFRLDSVTQRYNQSVVTAPADYKTAVRFEEQRGRGTEYALHTGLLWHATDRLNFGVSHQQGIDFDVRVSTAPPGVEPDQLDAVFHVPEVVRVGASYRFGSYTMMTVEVDRIRYSRLTHHFVPLHNEAGSYRADDGTEVHLGVQRFLVADWLLKKTRFPIVISLGAWRDPEHRVRYSGPDEEKGVLFRKGQDDYHVSFGAALAAGESYEIGIAYDHSERVRTGSLSAIVRF